MRDRDMNQFSIGRQRSFGLKSNGWSGAKPAEDGRDNLGVAKLDANRSSNADDEWMNVTGSIGDAGACSECSQ
jgi:hypothetical protein